MLRNIRNLLPVTDRFRPFGLGDVGETTPEIIVASLNKCLVVENLWVITAEIVISLCYKKNRIFKAIVMSLRLAIFAPSNQKTNNDMKTLKTTFKKYGETFRQVYRCDDFLVYQRSCDSYDDVYEVFLPKTNSMCPLDKNYNPDEVVEVYPSDEAFGDWAWCVKGRHQLLACLRLKLGLSVEDALYVANICSET